MGDAEGPPEITSLGEIVDQDYVAQFFSISKSTIRDWMRGANNLPPLPYIRIGKRPVFSTRQIAWWLQKVQDLGDPTMVNVRRALRERQPR